MGETRHLGLGVNTDRDEEERKRRESEGQYARQVSLNKWAFRTGCLNRSREYNDGDSSEDSPDGNHPRAIADE